ncbi:MAG: S41 family peptidase [Planctomycetota bacterium]
MPVRAALLIVLPLVFLGPLTAQDRRDVEDFEFVVKTVAEEGAAIRRHRIDWNGVAKTYRTRLEGVKDEAGLVALVMELLAECRDGHTGVLRHGVDRAKLPSKWDGLWSAGLWVVQEGGRFQLAGRDQEKGARPGATWVTVGGWPVHLAMERERRRCARIQGLSSSHSFFASIGNRAVPMGEAESIELGFLVDGEVETEPVRRWGPTGRGFDSMSVDGPEGLARKDGAVGYVLSGEGAARIGYLRITGSMDEATAKAFHAAMDELGAIGALVLDCRGMGGGGDGPAWDVAGRFFAKPVGNGRNGRIEPTGSKPFLGPVLMIQDELEVSSAETFTWAMSETGRAISIGRPTGGWSIIPRRFRAPSGRFDFRVGVTDRPTPIRGILTEGTGWAPDLLVPRGPVLTRNARFTLELATGLAALALAEGEDATRDLVRRLGEGRFDEIRQKRKRARSAAGAPDLVPLVEALEADLTATLDLETALLERCDPPDVLGARARLEEIRPRAREAGAKRALTALERKLKGLAGEARAQEALLEALDARFSWSERERASFLKAHGRSAHADFARKNLPGKDDASGR